MEVAAESGCDAVQWIELTRTVYLFAAVSNIFEASRHSWMVP